MASSQSRTGRRARRRAGRQPGRAARLEIIELPARGGRVDELGQAGGALALPRRGPGAGLVVGKRREVVAERDEVAVVAGDGAARIGPADRRVLGSLFRALGRPSGLGEGAQADAELAEGRLRQARAQLRDGVLTLERGPEQSDRVEPAKGCREHHPVLKQEAQPSQGLPAAGKIGERHRDIFSDRGARRDGAGPARWASARQRRCAGRAPRSAASGRISRAGEPA